MKLKISAIFIALFLCFFLPTVSFGQIDELFLLGDEPMTNPVKNETSSQEINLKELNLYWSAETYTPFGYQGRTLPIKNSWVDVSSVLKVTGAAVKDLKYSWFLDGVFQGYKSGYGQTDFRFGIRRENGQTHTVRLQVFNENRSFLTERTITIPVSRTDIVIYQAVNDKVNLRNDLSAKNSSIFATQENSFSALPYFFTIKTVNNLKFTWDFANRTIDELSDATNMLNIKITNKPVGDVIEQALKVFGRNRNESGQTATEAIKINIH